MLSTVALYVHAYNQDRGDAPSITAVSGGVLASGSAPGWQAYVKKFISHQRLPFALGLHPTADPLSGATPEEYGAVAASSIRSAYEQAEVLAGSASGIWVTGVGIRSDGPSNEDVQRQTIAEIRDALSAHPSCKALIYLPLVDRESPDELEGTDETLVAGLLRKDRSAKPAMAAFL